MIGHFLGGVPQGIWNLSSLTKGSNPGSLAVRVWSLNYWTTREFPWWVFRNAIYGKKTAFKLLNCQIALHKVWINVCSTWKYLFPIHSSTLDIMNLTLLWSVYLYSLLTFLLYDLFHFVAYFCFVDICHICNISSQFISHVNFMFSFPQNPSPLTLLKWSGIFMTGRLPFFVFFTLFPPKPLLTVALIFIVTFEKC